MRTRSPVTSAPAARHRRKDSGSRETHADLLQNRFGIGLDDLDRFGAKQFDYRQLAADVWYLAALVRARVRRASRPRRRRVEVSVTVSSLWLGRPRVRNFAPWCSLCLGRWCRTTAIETSAQLHAGTRHDPAPMIQRRRLAHAGVSVGSASGGLFEHSAK